MELKKINELLENFFEEFKFHHYNSKCKPIYKNVIKEITSPEGEQGASGEEHWIYDIGLTDGYFLKLVIGTNSYGDDKRMVSFNFVQKTTKTVETFE